MFSSIHILWWEIHAPCMWGASSVKWHSTFSQWDLSIQQASHNSLTCLHVYVGCDTMLMNIPQKAIVVKSRKCNMIPKNIPFRLKSPLETVTFNWQKVHVWCQNCGYLLYYLDLACFILCAHNPKVEFLHWQLPRKLNYCIQIALLVGKVYIELQVRHKNSYLRNVKIIRKRRNTSHWEAHRHFLVFPTFHKYNFLCLTRNTM